MKRCCHLAASLFRALVPVILALLLFGVSSDTVRSHSGGTSAAGGHANGVAPLGRFGGLAVPGAGVALTAPVGGRRDGSRTWLR